MASVQSAHMNYDPLSAPAGTKRKIGEVGGSSGQVNDAEAETPSTHELGAEGDSEPRGEMSETKRRAQNRAAQRAFRERKERHLKELETRLAQLESESRSWKSTNMALRSQLSLLEEELQHYRRPQGGEPSNAHAPGLDAQTGGLPAHMLPRQGQAAAAQQPPYAGQLDRPQRDARSSSSQNGSSPESMSIPGLSFDSPGSGSSATPNRADEFCDKLSLACGTRDRPVPIGAPQIAAESPRWQEDAILNGLNSDWTRRGSWGAGGGGVPAYGGDAGLGGPDAFALPAPSLEVGPESGAGAGGLAYGGAPPGKMAGTDDPLNLDFGILASGFGGFGAPAGKPAEQQSFSTMSPFPTNNVSGLLNNDYGMFDPLEDMLEWTPTKDSQQAPLPPQQQQPQPPQQQPSPAQHQHHTSQQPAPPRHSPGSQAGAPQGVSPHTQPSPRHAEPTFKVEESDMGQMGLGYFGSKGLGPLDGLEEQVPAASQRFIPCSDVWDRICSHPRFGEIDINSMCQELRSRARCSNTGVVLDEEDVNKVLGTIG